MDVSDKLLRQCLESRSRRILVEATEIIDLVNELDTIRNLQKQPTSEKAKRSIQVLINANSYVARNGAFRHELNEAICDAMDALRQKQPEPEPCEWCRTEYGKIPTYPCGNGEQGLSATFTDNGIVLMQYGYALGYINVRNCPNCGRRLGGLNR